jgi:hypothetical protein
MAALHSQLQALEAKVYITTTMQCHVTAYSCNANVCTNNSASEYTLTLALSSHSLHCSDSLTTVYTHVHMQAKQKDEQLLMQQEDHAVVCVR